MIKILSKNITVNTPNIMCEAYYDITARTKTSVTIKFTVKSWLSSGSSLGQGSTYGIKGYFKILGKEYYIKIKGTTSSDKWSSGTTYTATATHTISGIKGRDTKLTDVTYRQTRTGDKDDGQYINAGEFAHTSCSDIEFDSYPVSVKVKAEETYKDGTLYIKKDEEWTKSALTLYTKVDGVWKEAL